MKEVDEKHLQEKMRSLQDKLREMSTPAERLDETHVVWVMWSVLTDFFKKSALKWSSFCLKSLVFGLKVCSLRAMLAIFAVKYSVVRYMVDDHPFQVCW